MRRMQWQTSSHNMASQRLGQRMGHKFEGVQRNLKAWHIDLEGAQPGREGDGATQKASRDTWWGAATWKDWVEGGQENVRKLMAREF
jgi:RimJ/RimL family protein N-acetyltransferase